MKKICILYILCCLFSGTVYAKDVFYEKFTDEVSGREIEYFDLGGENTVRIYFTQAYWLKDSDALVVGSEAENKLYRYNIDSHTVDNLANNKSLATLDFAISNENIMYFVNKNDRKIYRENLETNEISYVTDLPTSSASLLHTTLNGKFLTITGGGFPVYDVENGIWDRRYSKTFPSPNTIANHVMINPIYENLILFAHEGTTTDIFDRVWRLDRNTGVYENIFKQYHNIADVVTGETTGHESWTYDGESVVAVKYTYPDNVGKSGIVRMNKNGGEREYLNSDYEHWHCSASPDGRWIVSDTFYQNSYTRIVMTDSKTGASHIIAYQKAGGTHPWHPHPQFSPDGKKVTFSMIRRQINGTNVLGLGIVDVSNLIDDGQIVDTVYEKANEWSGFRVSPVEIYYNGEAVNEFGLGTNEARVEIENLDNDLKNLSLYTAVYDAGDRLISISSNSCEFSSDQTLLSEFEWTEESKTLKCFLWDKDNKPVMLSDTTVEKLRAAKIGINNIVLSWQASNNLTDISYEVYRNGEKLAEITDCVYRDYNLDVETEYIYEVMPVHKEGYIAVGGSGVTIQTEAAYSLIGGTTQNFGLTFLDNDNNVGADSFTLHSEIGGEECRKAIFVALGTEYMGTVCAVHDRVGLFYFKCDRDIIDSDTRNVKVGIRYYDNGTKPVCC